MRGTMLRLLAGGFLLASAIQSKAEDGALRWLQKPIAWMVGQQTRIVIQTPPDCGSLEVTMPDQVELVDRWPWRQGQTSQKFYFRAKAPLAESKLEFTSGKYSLVLPIEILSWAQSREPRKFEQWDLPRVFPMDGKDEPKKGITFLDEDVLSQLRKAGLSGVDKIANSLPEDAELYYSLPETTIPRAVFVQYHRPKGCPICGPKIFEGRSRTCSTSASTST